MTTPHELFNCCLWSFVFGMTISRPELPGYALFLVGIGTLLTVFFALT